MLYLVGNVAFFPLYLVFVIPLIQLYNLALEMYEQNLLALKKFVSY